ncbi:hypothetical protein K491DRAFT_717408 [Lophiostoma macrostomum CBS 122681]|uniref:RING-type domain-containing protein n=1 Tax=Lophiostoma macrostomum CBS 122681 TaxID=1314788 RepID=A0A6A6T2X9_9PLEO|nr:hypothetical protein K491DRAFT_717408 [Lophiostoma macrostomum CBS 122681]
MALTGNKRKAKKQATVPRAKRRAVTPEPSAPSEEPCPHSWKVVKVNDIAEDHDPMCRICLERFLDIEHAGETPICMLPFGHVFCGVCIESHRDQSLSCPIYRCSQLPQPETCSKCKAFVVAHPGQEHVVITIKPYEILGELKQEMKTLADDHPLFKLPSGDLKALNRFWADILKKCKNQHHDADDLAEMLDPFIVEAERVEAKKRYGEQCFEPLPATQAKYFQDRDPESQDYSSGQEPWLAAFLRQWAEAYVLECGTTEPAFKWGVLAPGQNDDNIMSMYWRVKRILGHRKDGEVWKYYVEWVGKRWPPEVMRAEDLVEQQALVSAYNEEHGIATLHNKIIELDE